MEEGGHPTAEELSKLRVVDLKARLTSLGLPLNGVKKDLVERLHNHYVEQAGDDEVVEEEEEAHGGEDEEGESEDMEEASPEQQVEETPETSPEPESVSPPPAEEESREVVEPPPKAPAPAAPPRMASPPPQAASVAQPPPVVQQPPPAVEQPPVAPISAGAQVAPPPRLAPPPVLAPPPMMPPSGSFGGRSPAPEEADLNQMFNPPPGRLNLQFNPPKAHPAGPPPQEAIKPPVKSPQASPKVQEALRMQEMYDDDDEEEEEEEEEKSEGAKVKGRRKKQKKKKRKNRPEQWAKEAVEAERRKKAEEEKEKTVEDVEVEYIADQLDLDPLDPMYRTFSKIFQAFKIVDPEDEKKMVEEEAARKHAEEFKKVPKLMEDDDMLDDEGIEKPGDPKMSKRKLKKMNRLSVAELKQLVARPDVVEMHDVTARDPRLLVHLKSTRNTVPVPRHWCFKRKYLQGKRGIEKPPFDLPDFIKKTGIMEMREALQEKEDKQGLKSKMREKARPKMGKIDIDYQKLHDAFFKWQTKPRMTLHGDLYYEGKEFEIRLKEKKPGDLSDDLRTSLGMPVGPNAHKVPPPWLIAMQRYGPPPSYPNLKIPGLNAPIPDGCSFGYHAGGWGKPPVDELGKPLYGDVFGTADASTFHAAPTEEIDHSLWGEMDSESEEESSEEEEDEDEEEGGDEATGLQTPVVEAGLATPSGTASSVQGLETPESLELRKRRIEADMEGGETPSLPYQIIPEKQGGRIGAAMMGSTHTYDIKRATGTKSRADTQVEMALNPEEIENMDSETMAIRAEAALREQQSQLAKEDLSDMVAEHAAKQKNKRKRQEQKEDPKQKKYKEFKF